MKFIQQHVELFSNFILSDSVNICKRFLIAGQKEEPKFRRETLFASEATLEVIGNQLSQCSSSDPKGLETFNWLITTFIGEIKKDVKTHFNFEFSMIGIGALAPAMNVFFPQPTSSQMSLFVKNIHDLQKKDNGKKERERVR